MNCFSVIKLLPQTKEETDAFVDKVQTLIESGLLEKPDLADILVYPRQMIERLEQLTK